MNFSLNEGKTLKVLVLEDDPTLRFALTQILEDAGHTPYAAANIPAASEILSDITPDLLLLDLMIGQEISIQVADLAGYRAPDAEIVYLTGSNRFPNGELFQLSKNISLVLRKPVNFNELKAILQHFEATRSRASSEASSPLAIAS
jgi:CheY-like chemotaxis protein